MTVFDGKLPINEALALFSQAAVVVGVHGGALANVVACGEGTLLVEIGFTAGYTRHYAAVALGLGWSIFAARAELRRNVTRPLALNATLPSALQGWSTSWRSLIRTTWIAGSAHPLSSLTAPPRMQWWRLFPESCPLGAHILNCNLQLLRSDGLGRSAAVVRRSWRSARRCVPRSSRSFSAVRCT